MAIVTAELVKLGARVADKLDAIRQAGALLVAARCVEPGYVEGMLAREASMSTYLGAGVAIPHGKFDDLERVHRTGIAVLQVPEGVEWEPGERAYLVVGIAARGDEHVDVLQRLAQVVEDEAQVRALFTTADPAVIVESLGRPPAEE